MAKNLKKSGWIDKQIGVYSGEGEQNMVQIMPLWHKDYQAD